MNLRKRVLQSISAALLLLFIAYLSISISYTHIHNIQGAVVVHIHPFDKDSDKTHTHTLHEVLLILERSVHMAFLLFFTGILLYKFFVHTQYSFQRVISVTQNVTHYVFHHRGPPAVIRSLIS